MKTVIDVPMRPHQKEALKKLHDGCILWGGVGVGKSRVAVAYYAHTEENEDLYVITTAKKRDAMDWNGEAAQFGVGPERGGTLHGQLVVDSWNNLHKYTGVEDAFFVFDEQRLVGNGEWVKNFLKIAKKNRWIMLSATPGDTWLDYIPVFIANGFYKNRSEFKRDHVVYSPYAKFPRVDRYLGVQKLVKLRNQTLIKMPFEKETVRHSVNIWVNHDPKLINLIEHDLWHPFKNRPLRDVAEKFYIMRQVTNSDPARMEKLQELMGKHSKLIVFYNFNYELAILRTLKAQVTFAEWNGHKHEELPQGDKWVYAVQFAAGSEGWNCVETNSIVFWSLTYSYKMWEQAHGRIDRLNTNFTDLYYYVFRSKAQIDMAIWRALKAKKSFQNAYYDLKNSQFAEIR